MNVHLTLPTIINQLLNGFALGTLLVLMAVGLTIILGLMRVINFTHGVLFALGAYTVVSIFAYTGFWPCLIIGPLVIGAFGMALESTLIRHVYHRDPLHTLLLTFGLALMIEDLIRMAWGDAPYPMSPPALFEGVVNLKLVIFSKYRFFVIIFGALLLGVVWYFLERSNLGKTILAGTFDREMVIALGIPINLLFTITFGLGAALAGLAGVLNAPIQGVFPTMGSSILMPCFVVVIIGGMGSFWGAVIGGLLVGVVQSFTVEIFSAASEVIVFILMAIVLLVRPRGIAGIEGLLE
jgi:branched-subunit amino acid ABC-type transport system permease component